MLHLHVSMIHVHVSILHVHADVQAACPCCTSRLHFRVLLGLIHILQHGHQTAIKFKFSNCRGFYPLNVTAFITRYYCTVGL
jgi:hypothetical protein